MAAIQRTSAADDACPDQRTLKRFARASLDEEAADRLLKHLDTCANCSAHVETELHDRDAVIRELRACRELPQFDEPVSQLIEQLESLPFSREDDERTRVDPEARGQASRKGSPESDADDKTEFLEHTRLGNYELRERLGQGGMGTVYRAVHSKLKRVFAVKTLAPKLVHDPEVLARFRREVEASGRLQHPNIVAASDADEADGVHFLVMEYVDGSNLAELVRRDGPLGTATSVDYILQAARGLSYAHQAGVIHRDIKPSNLIVDGSGTVKVLDMGLARLEKQEAETVDASGLTVLGQVMGTADYMSPEQSLDTHVADERSDIYSLGCTLHFLLTGTATYPGKTVAQKLVAHREHPVPRLRDLVGRFPDQLDQAFQKMIAKKADDRFQSMEEVVLSLETCLADWSESGPSPLESGPSPPKSGPSPSESNSNDESVSHIQPSHRSEVAMSNDDQPKLPPEDVIQATDLQSGLQSGEESNSNATLPMPGGPSLTDASPDGLAGQTLPTGSTIPPGVMSAGGVSMPEAFGRYRIMQHLGSGAMGDVYKAHDTQLDRLVALKIPRLSDGAKGVKDATQRFLREARSAASLRNTNICPVFDVGEIDGRAYLTMAFIDGVPLSKWFRETDRTTDEIVEVVAKLGHALQEAHDQGIVHRDLKPENVMMDAKDEPVIMDFGLARRSEAGDARLTKTGMILGSPAYMPPEQVDGDAERIGPASDQYALGVTLYEMLSKTLPFDGTVSQVLVKILTKPPVELRELDATIDPDLAAICMRAMSKSVEDRYPSATEFAQALSEWRSRADQTDIKPQPDATTIDDTQIEHTKKQAAPQQVSMARDTQMEVESQTAAQPTKRASIPKWAIALVSCVVVGVGGWAIVNSFSVDTDSLDTEPEDVAIVRGSGPEEPAEPEVVRADAWQPGPAEDVLPGLIPRPRTFDGIKRWQVSTTQPRAPIVSLAFSPDGKFIACGTASGDTRIYDVATQKLVRLFLVTGRWISWSPDSQRIAVAPYLRVLGLDGSVSPIFEDDEGRAHGPIAWHPDGEWIAASVAKGGIRLFKPDGTVGLKLPDSTNSFSSLAWTPDGSRLAAVHAVGNDIQQWSFEGIPGELLHGRGAMTNTIAWGPNSERLAALDKQYLKFFNIDGTEAKSIDLQRTDHGALSWSPDGTTLAVAGPIGQHMILLTPDGEQRAIIDRHPGRVLAWSPDSRWLATSGAVGGTSIRLWTPAGKPGPVFQGIGASGLVNGTDHAAVNAVAWNHTGTRFATSGNDGTVRVWQADGSFETRLRGNRHTMQSVSWSPDDNQVVAGCSIHVLDANPSLGVWSVDAPDRFREPPEPMPGIAAWSPKGEWIAVGAFTTKKNDGHIRLLRASDLRTDKVFAKTESSQITALAWSPQGDWLASAENSSIRLWRPTGEQGAVLQKSGGYCVAWNRNGQFLVGGGIAALDRIKLRMWRSDGSEIPPPSGVLNHYLFAVVWNHDGTRFVSGGDHGFLQIWKASGNLERTISAGAGHSSILSLSCSPNEQTVLAAHRDSTIQQLNLDTGEQDWIAVCLDDDQAATFSLAGQLLHSTPSAESLLVYVIETNDDRQLTLKPSEFRSFVNSGQLPEIEPGDSIRRNRE